MKGSQRGAALVVGLLLLLVLTLLAVSGMNTASVELIMAGNTQYHQNAFQAAETGIERALVNGDFNPAGVTERFPALPADPDEPASGEAIPGTDNRDQFVTLIAAQLNGAPQPALYGMSWDSFSTFHFEIESTGTSARNAIAVNRQGVAVIAPHDPTVMPLDPTSPVLTP
jgi:type IV pilus assembly protein PilX